MVGNVDNEEIRLRICNRTGKEMACFCSDSKFDGVPGKSFAGSSTNYRCQLLNMMERKEETGGGTTYLELHVRRFTIIGNYATESSRPQSTISLFRQKWLAWTG